MSDLTLPEPPRRDRWIVWTALASVILHAGVLVLLLWQPLPESAEAAPPPAIDVELVPPAEPASEPPPVEEPSQEASAEPAAEPAPPAEASAQEMPSEPETPKTASEPPVTAAPSAFEAAASAAPPEATAGVAPMPMSRPRVRGLTASSDAPDEGVSTSTADTGGMAEGTAPAPAGSSAEPDVATLELGAPREAERFYLEAMLTAPGMGQAREMLGTLPHEKRLAQTCNIEALAQIGYAGEGFAPDVVMAEAYARLEMTGTRLMADGAIFRSGEKWYGVAFDCTLSDDLTRVTAFSYRLGADVTEAVLARLSKN